MSSNRVAGGILVVLAVAIGCANKPEPPPPDVSNVPNVQIAPQPPEVPPLAVVPAGPGLTPMPRPNVPAVVRWVPGTKEEQSAFIAHIPEPIRKLYGSDPYQCFTDLEGKAFAWEYTGGPVRLWLEFEEKGQSTVPKRYPQGEGWLVKGETGRVIFWVRRGVSDRINTALKRAGKPEGDTSGVALGLTATSPAGGLNASVSYVNPLWYGWAGYKFGDDQPSPEVRLSDNEAAVISVLDAKEMNARDKEPRRAKLTLKIQRIRPE